jgi:formate dehydrogenase major subunit
VIVAIGQASEPGGSGLAEDGQIRCDTITLQTSKQNIFLAGDLHSGPSSVVHAMASGRRAAESVKRFLAGEDLRLGRGYIGPYETHFTIDTRRGSRAPRAENPLRAFGGDGDFSELEQPLTSDSAKKEAGRCYSCGAPFGKFRTCWFCLPCEVECPNDALWVDIPYLLR